MNIFLPLFLAAASHVMPSAPKHTPPNRNGYSSDTPNFMGRQPDTKIPGDAAPIWLPKEEQAFYDKLLPSQQTAYLQLGSAQRKELNKVHRQSQEKEQAAAHQTMEKYLKGEKNKKTEAGQSALNQKSRASNAPSKQSTLEKPPLTQLPKQTNKTHVIPNAARTPDQKNSR